MIAERSMPGPMNELDPQDWWSATDDEILACLRRRGAVTPGELCDELGFSEGAATAFLAMLAREGRVRICRVELAA